MMCSRADQIVLVASVGVAPWGTYWSASDPVMMARVKACQTGGENVHEVIASASDSNRLCRRQMDEPN